MARFEAPDEFYYALKNKGLNYADIAEVMDTTEDAARGRVGRYKRSAQLEEPGNYVDTWDATREWLETLREPFSIMVWPDMHLPFHDKTAVTLALRIAEWFQPFVHLLNGDTFDFAGISRFTKDRRIPRRDILREVTGVYQRIAQDIVRFTEDNGVIVLRMGNHDGARLDNYLNEHWEFADTLQDAFFNLIQLGGKIQIDDYKEEMRLLDTRFHHGTRVGENAAKMALQDIRHQENSVQSHTHRPGNYVTAVPYKGSRKIRTSLVTPCLSQIPPPYEAQRTDYSLWINGIALGWIDPVNGVSALDNVLFHPTPDGGLAAAVGNKYFIQERVDGEAE